MTRLTARRRLPRRACWTVRHRLPQTPLAIAIERLEHRSMLSGWVATPAYGFVAGNTVLGTSFTTRVEFAESVLENLTGDYGEELERGLVAVYPVALRPGRRVSVKPLVREEYERGDSPLLREVRRSGVAA